MINAVYRGAQVICLARNAYRSKLAKRPGAKNVLNPENDDVVANIKDLTGGQGASKSVETSCQARYMDLLMQAA